MDLSFRDLMAAIDPSLAHVPFGGKLIVLGGDFRQTMPVIRRAGAYCSTFPNGLCMIPLSCAGRAETINAILHRSPLWEHCTTIRLVDNMRVLRAIGDRAELADFAAYLLRVGEGTVPHDESCTISLREELCFAIPPPPSPDLRELMAPRSYEQIFNWVLHTLVHTIVLDKTLCTIVHKGSYVHTSARVDARVIRYRMSQVFPNLYALAALEATRTAFFSSPLASNVSYVSLCEAPLASPLFMATQRLALCSISLKYGVDYAQWLSKRALLAPLNRVVGLLNDSIMDNFPGDTGVSSRDCMSIISVGSILYVHE